MSKHVIFSLQVVSYLCPTCAKALGANAAAAIFGVLCVLALFATVLEGTGSALAATISSLIFATSE